MKYYFAYGSNLLRERIEERVGKTGESFVARLADWKLCWDGSGRDGSAKCRIKPAAGEQVYGVIYPLTDEQFDVLDHYEGAPNWYARKSLMVQIDGKDTLAIAYDLLDSFIAETNLPYDWYRDHVLFGAIQHQCPQSWIESLRSVSVAKDLDIKRQEKERRIHYLSGFLS